VGRMQSYSVLKQVVHTVTTGLHGVKPVETSNGYYETENLFFLLQIRNNYHSRGRNLLLHSWKRWAMKFSVAIIEDNHYY
jgi:hypothetical protein